MKILGKINGEKRLVLADQLVVSGAGFAINLLVARGLGLTMFGIFSAIGLVQMFLLSISMAVGSQVYQVAYPGLDEEGKKQITHGMLLQLLLGCAFCWSCVFMLSHLFRSLTIKWLHFSPATLLVATTAVLLFLVHDFLRRVFITQQKTGTALMLNSLSYGIQLVALFTLWFAGRMSPHNVWAVIAASLVPSVLTGIFLLGRIHTRFSGAMRFSWSVQKGKTGWLLGASLLQWGSGYFFVIAAGWWIGPAALGALRLAQYIFGLLNVLLQAVENYALPRAAMSGLDPRSTWSNLLVKCFVLIVPLLIMLAAAGKQVLWLAGGSEYASYAYVIYGLCLVYVLVTIGYPVRIMVRALQLERAYFTAYVFSVLISVALAPLLLSRWQLYGVLTGLFLTQALTIGYWLFILQRKHQFLWKSFT